MIAPSRSYEVLSHSHSAALPRRPPEFLVLQVVCTINDKACVLAYEQKVDALPSLTKRGGNVSQGNEGIVHVHVHECMCSHLGHI